MEITHNALADDCVSRNLGFLLGRREASPVCTNLVASLICYSLDVEETQMHNFLFRVGLVLGVRVPEIVFPPVITQLFEVLLGFLTLGFPFRGG
jgi:hypothetical protein